MRIDETDIKELYVRIAALDRSIATLRREREKLINDAYELRHDMRLYESPTIRTHTE